MDTLKNNKAKILNKLGTLAGLWRSKGEMQGDNSSRIAVEGTDEYEWMPGKQFLVHRADVRVGEEQVNVIEIIGGYDDAKGAYAMHAFQNDGSHGVMWASLNKDGSLLFAGDIIRATLTVNEDGETMHAIWERLNGPRWVHWIDMDFLKA